MAKKYISLSKLSKFLDNLKETFSPLVHKHTISDVTDFTIDKELSSTSTNPVQNKVINDELEAISEAFAVYESALDNKADEFHNHVISDVTNLQSTLDGKVPTTRTVNGKALSSNIALSASDVGADASGCASAVQTNLDVVSDKLDGHVGNTAMHTTSSEKTNWNTAYTHSQASHARTDATKVAKSTTNGNILINGTETVVYTHPSGTNPHGTTKNDIGLGNVNDTSDANKPVSIAQQAAIDAVQTNVNTVQDELTEHIDNDDIHFTAAERTKLSGIAAGANKYTHPSSGVTAGTYKSVTVDAQGHVTAGTNPTTLAGYGITDADSKGAADTALTTAKSYTDSKISNLINSAPTTLDTLGELATAMEENKSVVDVLNDAIGTKANSSDLTSHTSNTSNPHNVTKSQIGLGSVENKSSATIRGEITSSNVTTALGYTPYTPAEVDEKLDNKVDAVSGKGLSTNDYTTTEKTKLSGIATGAEVNQNAFSNVVVGSTTIAADAKTDSLTLAGSNVTLTPDATNDKVTIGITKENVTSALGYTPPTTNTTYGVATSSALGLVKSGTDITVDSSGNVSVNDDSHNHIIANVDGLQDALDGKAASSHGTHVTYGTTTPLVAGTGAVGTSSGLARIDHVHPAQTTVSGNAGTATKLATSRTIDGVSFNGSAAITHYGTCFTANATVAKTVALTGFTLATGARVLVKFTVTNTAASPTLNVNSTGAKAIMYRGSAITAGYLAANRVYEFVYDGTDWEVVGDIDTNTTYTLSSIAGTLSVAKGGTGVNTLTSGQVLVGNGTSAVTTRAIDTTAGGTSGSTSLITSGAVYSGLSNMISDDVTAADIAAIVV